MNTDKPATPQDDTEGHRAYWSDENIKEEVKPVEWEEPADDTEGHRIYRTSDENIKEEISPVEWEEPADDTEGHAVRVGRIREDGPGYSSGALGKDDIGGRD